MSDGATKRIESAEVCLLKQGHSLRQLVLESSLIISRPVQRKQFIIFLHAAFTRVGVVGGYKRDQMSAQPGSLLEDAPYIFTLYEPIGALLTWTPRFSTRGS